MKVLQILSFVLLCANSLLAQDYSRSLVTTTGEAIVYAAPDEVLLSLNISTTGPEILEAKSKNDEISKATIKYLKSQGIASRHIQTQYLQITNLYKGKLVNKEIHDFRASQTINVCIKNVSEFPEIVESLLDIGVTTVGNPRFRTTELSKYQAEAKKKAVLDAKNKAGILASPLGQTVGTAFQIEDLETNNRGFNAEAYTDSGNSGNDFEPDGGANFAPGQILVRAKVKVSFVLRND